MGNCISNENYMKQKYIHDKHTYYKYCRNCDIYYSEIYLKQQDHYCKCKLVYYSNLKHCCYCKESFAVWKDHKCKCKNCTLLCTKERFLSFTSHSMCNKCFHLCSHDHKCENKIKYMSECDICYDITKTKELACCNSTKKLCDKCVGSNLKCPFCRKDIIIK
jgi:hypothetical protein